MAGSQTDRLLPRRLEQLGDGTIVLLREQTRADRRLLGDLFASLSSRSRYLRFGTGLPSTLPPRYLDVLADVDGDRHVAILAVHDGRAVGAARYIRDVNAPAEAEIAVTVTDALQRRGLGRALVEALTDVGAARGVERFTFEILPENGSAHALRRRLGGARTQLNVTSGSSISPAPASHSRRARAA